jgi:hypothetical protein
MYGTYKRSEFMSFNSNNNYACAKNRLSRYEKMLEGNKIHDIIRE